MKKIEKIDRVDPMNFVQFHHFGQNPPIVSNSVKIQKSDFSNLIFPQYDIFSLEL